MVELGLNSGIPVAEAAFWAIMSHYSWDFCEAEVKWNAKELSEGIADLSA